MQAQDLLFYLDGLMNQIGVTRRLFEHEQINTAPLDSLFASVMSLRNLIEVEAGPAEDPDEDGPCRHPESKQRRTDVGGGNYFITCLGCNEIIEQSSD